MSKVYTAQEMRKAAGFSDALKSNNPSEFLRIVGNMLRQAADDKKRLEAVMKECEKNIVTKCKKCKLSLNGKPRTFRGEPCNWHSDCGISEHDIYSSSICENILRLARGEPENENN